jgi:hypothetical protein
MAKTTEAVALGLQRLEEAKKPFLAGEANSTEAVLDAARAILLAGGREQDKALASSNSKKEKASDFMQRVMWAEVSVDGGHSPITEFATIPALPEVWHSERGEKLAPCSQKKDFTRSSQAFRRRAF